MFEFDDKLSSCSQKNRYQYSLGRIKMRPVVSGDNRDLTMLLKMKIKNE